MKITISADDIVAAGWASGRHGVAYVCDDPSHYLVPSLDWDAISDSLESLVDTAEADWTGCQWETASDSSDVSSDGMDIAAMRSAVDFLAAHGTDWCDEDDGATDEVRQIWRSAVGFAGRSDVSASHLRRAIESAERAIEYAEQVESDAASAAEYGREAVEHLRSGRLTDAAESIQSACTTESEYGDDPIWSVPRQWLRGVVDAIESLTPGEPDSVVIDGTDYDVEWRVRDGAYLLCRYEIRSPVSVGNWSWPPRMCPLPVVAVSAAT